MAEYKMSPGPRGRKLFFKTNEEGKFKMVSVKDIPEDVLATMELQKPVDDTKPEFRKCIFCGAPATEQKWVNLRLIDLCLKDYQEKTTGECAEQLRSIDSPLVPSNT